MKTLVLDKKIEDNGNKEYINVYNLMGHQVDYYREMHDDSKMTTKEILKNRKYKVIIAMYNNDTIGYMDLFKDNQNLIIKDLFIKDEVNNKYEVIYQMLVLVTKKFQGKIIVNLDQKVNYFDELIKIGFNLKNN